MNSFSKMCAVEAFKSCVIVDSYEEISEEDPHKVSYLLDSDLPLDDEDVLQQIYIASDERNFTRARDLIRKYPEVLHKNQSLDAFNVFSNAIRKKNVWLVREVINGNINLFSTDDSFNNCMNILFSSFCIRKIKSCAIANILINKLKSDRPRLYSLCNHYNYRGMTPVLDSIRCGDVDAIEHMVRINN